MADVFYSLGRAHPGALTLHNYPKHLQQLEKADGELVDLAAIDIMRIRERGVPRYNEFRRLFRLKPAASFEELTDNPACAEELRQIYGDVEKVDLMVGLYAEPKPPGFGFSDTAFRVFILMASRRLESDRFFTTDFRPEVYTPAAWSGSRTTRCAPCCCATSRPWNRRCAASITRSRRGIRCAVTGCDAPPPRCGVPERDSSSPLRVRCGARADNLNM
jgi:hypothetical protein